MQAQVSDAFRVRVSYHAASTSSFISSSPCMLWHVHTHSLFRLSLSLFSRQVPIFSSPQASTYLTTGRWSPTKPGMLFVAKQDGGVDVWDLTDSSYKPSTTLMVCPSLITSMEVCANALLSQSHLALSRRLTHSHVRPPLSSSLRLCMWLSLSSASSSPDLWPLRETSFFQWVTSPATYTSSTCREISGVSSPTRRIS